MKNVRAVSLALDEETDRRLGEEAASRKLSKSALLRALLTKVFKSRGPLL